VVPNGTCGLHEKMATFSAKISAGIRPPDRTLPGIRLASPPAAAGQSGHGSTVLPFYMDRQDEPAPRPWHHYTLVTIDP
jgi:hypothetical protein